MPIINGCCCWDSLKTGSKGASVFTFVTGMINLAIDIWMLYGIHHLRIILEEHEQVVYLPPGILVLGYIELAFNICSLPLSLSLSIGINRGYHGERLVWSWIYGVSILRLFEFLLGVYILVWIGSHRFSDIAFVVPESILISIYWIVNTIILMAAIICVVSYWQELINDIFGKERRVKYFKILANLRAAATVNRQGNMTTNQSYAPSRVISRTASNQDLHASNNNYSNA